MPTGRAPQVVRHAPRHSVPADVQAPFARQSICTAVHLAAVALVLVGLLNGAAFYLRRVGLLEAATYRAELRQFCAPPGPGLWVPARCHPVILRSRRPLRLSSLSLRRLHREAGLLRGLKLARLALLAAIALEGCRRWRRLGRRSARIPSISQVRPALPLLVSTALSLLISLATGPPALALGAALSSLWLLLVAFGGWLSHRRALAVLALAVAVLLLLQLPLVVFEAMRGLPMRFGPWLQNIAPSPAALPSRLVGSFVHPNSLGAAAICGLGFCLSYLRRRRGIAALFAAALVLVLAARSATGLVGLVVLLPFWRPLPRRLWLPLAILSLVLILLAPLLLGRPDLRDSLVGRIGLMVPLLDRAPPLTLIFGHGLAAYSNQLASLLGESRTLLVQSSDGMPALLLLQGGLLALVSFYGLLVWAWRVDRLSRPFLTAILLTSLTLNITELTPVGLLLGLSLSRVLLLPSRSRAAVALPSA